MKRTKFVKFISLFLIVLTLVTTFAPLTVFAGNKNKSDDEQDSDISFYRIASYASSAFEAELSGDTPINNADIYANISGSTNYHPGNSGTLAGFIDDSQGKAFARLSSYFSSSEMSRNYGTVKNEGNEVKGLQYYAYYGRALNSYGLDKTTTGTNVLAKVGRKVTGWLMLAGYDIASVVNAIFSFSINFLQWINPFYWFEKGADSVRWNGNVNSAVVSMNDKTTSMMSEFKNQSNGKTLPKNQVLVDWVSELYDNCREFAWVFLVISLAFLIIGFALKPNVEASKSKLKKFAIRFVFVCIGIPLIGLTYTGVLDNISDYVSENKVGYDTILASTFVDFESWAKNAGLAVPANSQIAINTQGADVLFDRNTINYSNTTSQRVLARRINQNSDYFHNTEDLLDIGTDTNMHLNDDTVDENTNMSQAVHGVTSSDWNTVNTTTMNKDRMSSCSELIKAYARGDVFTASDYESWVKGKMSSDELNKLTAWAKNLDSSFWKFWQDANFEEGVFNSFNKEEEGQGGDDGTGKKNITVESLFVGGELVAEEDSNGKVVKYTTEANGPGLSNLSMYNYLNSSFDKSSFTVYSPNKVSSGITNVAHYSVNLIGTGLTSGLYYVNTLLMFYVMGFIGVFYAFAILKNSLKRALRMILQVPFALLGSIKSIAKLISVAAMVIVEVVITILAFELMSNIILMVYSSFESLGAMVLNAFNSVGGMSTMVPVPTGRLVDASLSPMSLISSIISPATVVIDFTTVVIIIINIALFITAIRVRKALVKSVDEMLVGTIERFFDVQGGTGALKEPKGVGQKLRDGARGVAGTVAAGAGMALGNKIMTGAMGGDPAKSASGVEESKDEKQKDAEKDNDVSTDSESKGSGQGIEDANRQGVGGKGSSSSQDSKDGMSDKEAKQLAAQNADSLDDIKSVNADADANSADGKDGTDPNNKGDVKATATMNEMTGKTSAMDDEARDEKKADARKEANKEKAAAGVKAVKGGAEAVAGAATENPELVKKGAQDAGEGLKQAKAAEDARKDANAAIDAQSNAQAANKQEVEAESHTKNVSANESFDKSHASSDASSKEHASRDSSAVDSSKSHSSQTDSKKNVQSGEQAKAGQSGKQNGVRAGGSIDSSSPKQRMAQQSGSQKQGASGPKSAGTSNAQTQVGKAANAAVKAAGAQGPNASFGGKTTVAGPVRSVPQTQSQNVSANNAPVQAQRSGQYVSKPESTSAPAPKTKSTAGGKAIAFDKTNVKKTIATAGGITAAQAVISKSDDTKNKS